MPRNQEVLLELPAAPGEVVGKRKPIAGTPEDRIRAIAERRKADCMHAMLELWVVGDYRLVSYGSSVSGCCAASAEVSACP